MENSLFGGRTTEGVVRVGDTVRRPVRGDACFRQRLLAYLESREFPNAPRFLGIDGQGREILSYLPGEVPRDLGHFSDSQLSAAAGLLCCFHDATADFAPVREEGAEVVCHNDWSPTNAVFRDGMPWGIIDFDAAAPGPRLWDLGYSAWLWLDLGNPDHEAEEQLRRLRLFSQAYGPPGGHAAELTAFVLARQAALAASAEARGKTELAHWARSCAAWTAANVARRLLPIPD